MFHRLRIEKDIAIPVRDGGAVFANVFRPAEEGAFPVIITLGPYPKDVHFSQWNPAAWSRLPEQNEHMHWETVDPEWWVPQGYAVVRCDTRGTGKSPGRPRLLSRGEAEDFHDCVEWAGTQGWSNGRVAVMGVSYFAMSAWRVAALRPPHLAAIVPWEGAVDLYRDANRHGGIYSSGFMRAWGGHTRRYQTDGGAADPAPLPPETMTDLFARNQPDVADIQVPLLSAGNWSGAGLHLRGNVEGYLGASSAHKFLQLHVGDHVGPFYSLEGRLVQHRFLEHFLRDVDTGITREPPIRLAIRRDRDTYRWRYENEWPLARTQWTEHHLDATGPGLSTTRPPGAASASYDAEPGAARSCVRFTTGRSSRRSRSRARSSSSSGSRRRATTPICSRSCATCAPTARRSPFPARSRAARAPSPWRTAGCGCRIASSIRSARLPIGRITRTTRYRRCVPARWSRSRSRYCPPARSSSAVTGSSSRSAHGTMRAPSSSTTILAIGSSAAR